MREYRYDNLKALLIFLVVFGHFLTGMHARIPRWIYLNIYMFHMPLFIYISGRFARPGMNLWRSFLLPYLVWQIASLLYVNLLPRGNVSFSILTPYHHLWFLVAQMYYHGTVQLGVKATKLAVIIAFVCAILAGIFPFINNLMALSRGICFYPFFLMGRRKSLEQNNSSAWRRCSVFYIILIMALFWTFYQIPAAWVHYNISYSESICPAWVRAATLLAGAAWSQFLIQIMPNKELPVISRIGRYTFPIFILHVFVTLLANSLQLFREGSVIDILIAILLATGCCILFGREPLQSLTKLQLQKYIAKNKERKG